MSSHLQQPRHLDLAFTSVYHILIYHSLRLGIIQNINPNIWRGSRYGNLVRVLWSGTEKSFAPLKLRWTIGKFAPRFNGCQQHDAQELLAMLVDGLHEDLNRGVHASERVSKRVLDV